MSSRTDGCDVSGLLVLVPGMVPEGVHKSYCAARVSSFNFSCLFTEAPRHTLYNRIVRTNVLSVKLQTTCKLAGMAVECWLGTLCSFATFG